MRILRLTPHFYYPKELCGEWLVHLDQIGGMQTQIYRLALKISQKGVRQDIWTIGMPSADKIWFIDDNTKVHKVNLPIIPIKSRIRGTVGLNWYWGLGVILKLLKTRFTQKKDRFDIIHVHCSGVAAPLLIGILAKKILHIPIVYTIHCCRLSTYSPMSKFDRIINKAVLFIERRALVLADYIIALTPKTLDAIYQGYNVDYNKLCVLPDIINAEAFMNEVTDNTIFDFKKKFKLQENKKIITYVGRIAHEKGWRVLVDMIKNINRDDLLFIFCGDGNERKKLEIAIKKIRAEKKCIITGYVENTIVATVISLSDIVIMPSLHEEFGGVLLEVGAMRKPIIASNVGGIPLIIDHMKNGMLATVGDGRDFAAKVEYLLENEEIAREMGEKLYFSIQSKFDIVKVINKLLKIYEELVK